MISFQLRSIAKFSLPSKATPLGPERQTLQIHPYILLDVQVLRSPVLLHLQMFLHVSGKVQVLRAELAREVAVTLNAKLKGVGS